MPNIKSAEKRVRTSAVRRARNASAKSALRTSIKRFETALSENDPNVEVYLRSAVRALDKAASKGLIHKNTAARKKSRLTRKLATN